MRSLEDWLSYIEQQHPKSIALGVERVAVALARMKLALRFAVITVGGTNGKGSTSPPFTASRRNAWTSRFSRSGSAAASTR